ncbi:MAG: Na+/H+ antiporter subunit B [Chloroflexaceae bacterium]
MTSLIMRTATPLLSPLMVFFSIFLLVRGHNNPGGGFVGGLLAAAAFAMWAIAYNVQVARYRLAIDPPWLVGSGLLLALASGSVSLLKGEPFLTGKWVEIPIPLLGNLALGTPMVFDVGVYLVVLGVMMMIILNLAEE